MIAFIIISLLIALYIANYIISWRKYPTGPFPLPLLGNIPQNFYEVWKAGSPVAVMKRWKEVYGPFYTLWLGPMPMILIGDFETAQESLIKKGASFVDRFPLYLFNISRQGRGILVSEGQEWQEQRRFALQTLRDFGLGKNIMEERIMLELDYRMSLLDKEILTAGGEMTWDPQDFTELTVGNIINRILFSERFTEVKEKEFFWIKGALDEQLTNSSVVDPLLRDWNKDWPFFRTRYQRVKEAEERVVAFIKEQIEQKKAAGDSGYSEDFVDAYLSKMKSGDCSSNFDEHSLIATLLDLWAAGQETTAGTVYWGISYLLRYPEVLKKLQKEVDEVTRRNRHIGLADKTSTPYLNAVVQETFRVSTLLPLNMPRRTSEDVTVFGHNIPKGTGIGLQMGVIMNDERHFKNPEEFNPDRFLDGESEQFVIPFGLGRRICPGESLARAEVYTILGNVALHYDLKSIEGKLPRMEAKTLFGAMRKAFPYECVISKRG